MKKKSHRKTNKNETEKKRLKILKISVHKTGELTI